MSICLSENNNKKKKQEKQALTFWSKSMEMNERTKNYFFKKRNLIHAWDFLKRKYSQWTFHVRTWFEVVSEIDDKTLVTSINWRGWNIIKSYELGDKVPQHE